MSVAGLARSQPHAPWAEPPGSWRSGIRLPGPGGPGGPWRAGAGGGAGAAGAGFRGETGGRWPLR